jgi:two-component system response regulator AtoC
MAVKCLGYGVEVAEDGDEALTCMERGDTRISGVLLDLIMPRKDGLDTLREIRQTDPQMPVIMISGVCSTLHIVEAMKLGATDFLEKPVGHDQLRKALSKAFAMHEAAPGISDNVLHAVPERAEAPSDSAQVFFGTHPRYKEIKSLVPVVGWSDEPVLIQGETGSGKEVLARQLHANSPRSKKPFLKINCAALPTELVESELFGYERGAFTGAFQKKAGMFEMADGGTVLLDEIGDMDFKLQAKLLQVLQDREFHRIGGKDTVRVDVRIMAATHRDLDRAIGERAFREDLYYRLNVINLKLPPLRDCKDDILSLSAFLIKKLATSNTPALGIPPVLRDAMLAHNWPGNVRELENVMRKYLVFRSPELVAQDLRSRRTWKSGTNENGIAILPQPASDAQSPILEQVTKAKRRAESEAIMAALNSTNWNRKQAAHLLKVDYKVLLYRIKKLGLEEKIVAFHRASPKSAVKTGTTAGDELRNYAV